MTGRSQNVQKWNFWSGPPWHWPPQMRPLVNLPEVWGTKPAWLDTSWSVEVPSPGLISPYHYMLAPLYPFVVHPFLCNLLNKKDAHRGLEYWKYNNFLWRIPKSTNWNIYVKDKLFNSFCQVRNFCWNEVSLVRRARRSESSLDIYFICYLIFWGLVGMEAISC